MITKKDIIATGVGINRWEPLYNQKNCIEQFKGVDMKIVYLIL